MKLTKKGLQQLRNGHPWLYDDMVEPKGAPSEAAVIPIGEHWFLYSPKGKLKLRRLGPSTRLWPSESVPREVISTVDSFRAVFSQPLKRYLLAITRNQSRLIDEDSCFRWIFAENQGLPGLVIDVFQNFAVAQLQSQAIEDFWPVLQETLDAVWRECFPDRGNLTWVLDRSSALRKLEGLEVEKMTIEATSIPVTWNGLKWYMRPGSNQKTGAYLDQRLNHRKARDWAARMKFRNAWDLCCFEGGFGVHLAAQGLKVKFLDQSEQALKNVQANLTLNSLNPQDHEFIREDIFDFLKARAALREDSSIEKADMIILDPPAFTKSKNEKARALRGYFELHRQSLRCLKSESMLVTCSCSHHIQSKDLEETLREAAHASRRDVRLVDQGGPAADHGRSVGFPESEYLHALYAIVT